MSQAFNDTPDGQYAVVGGQALIGEGVVGTPLTVTIPVNCESLLIFVGEVEVPPNAVVVRGTTSGLYYPTTFLGFVNSSTETSIWAAMVTSVIDSEIDITCNGSSGAAFYVVSDSAARLVGDLVLSTASGTPGVNTPNTAVLVAGTDGVKIRALETDSNGRLVPLVPSQTTGIKTATTTSSVLLPFPHIVNNYIFGIDIEGVTAANIVTLSDSVLGVIAILSAPLGTVATYDLHGFATANEITMVTSANTANVVLRYAPGP